MSKDRPRSRSYDLLWVHGKASGVRRFCGGSTLTSQPRLEEFNQEIPLGLTVCSACDHLVPHIIICLWCGAKLEEGPT